MVTLNFPNGNVQTYPSFIVLRDAVEAMGGKFREVAKDTYVFIPKQ